MTVTAPSYAGVLVQISPRPIRQKAALDRIYKSTDKLMNQPALTRTESEMLELPSTLFEQYEAREHPTSDVSTADILEHLIKSRGNTDATLGAETDGPRSIVTDILAARCRISLGNARKSPLTFVSRLVLSCRTKQRG